MIKGLQQKIALFLIRQTSKKSSFFLSLVNNCLYSMAKVCNLVLRQERSQKTTLVWEQTSSNPVDLKKPKCCQLECLSCQLKAEHEEQSSGSLHLCILLQFFPNRRLHYLLSLSFSTLHKRIFYKIRIKLTFNPYSERSKKLHQKTKDYFSHYRQLFAFPLFVQLLILES